MAVNGQHHLRGRAPGDLRLDLLAAQFHHLVEVGVGVAVQVPPGSHRLLPQCALGRIGAALDVVEGGVIHRHHAHARPGLDGHIAHGHTALHAHGAHDLTAKLDGVAAAAGGADPADHGQHHVLGRHPGLQGAVDAHQHIFHFLLDQALGGQHVLHLRGAYAMGQGAEGAVGGGVGIPADHGHAGQGCPLLGAHHVDDALAAVIDFELDDVEVAAVVVEGLHLQPGYRVGNGRDAAAALHLLCGDIVVRHRQVGIPPPQGSTGQAQPLERLG